MRVITGTARGRRLKELEGTETRPTTDRVKEGLFSALQFDIEGRRVLDLFAGTGQLGIECLSRGAASAVFVDRRADAVKLIRENLKLTELQDRDGRLMSGGQMRRASLAIGIALNPGILLLDEPTANLDIATRREILTVLEEMKDIIQTAVIATHDMQLVCQWADRIVVLCGGKVVADGPRDQVFSDREVARLVGIRPPEIFTMAQALDEQALCYTVQEFLDRFREEKDGKADEKIVREHPGQVLHGLSPQPGAEKCLRQ